MDDRFKIYIDQLRDGHVEKIQESFEPGFLDVQEKDLAFKKNVYVEGDAYIAHDALVLHLNINTVGILPCIICNEPVQVDIKVHELYHLEPLLNIKSGLFFFKDLLREAILLETPGFAECSGGQCPHRKEVAQYLKSEEDLKTEHLEEGYHPFADLNLEDIKQKTSKEKKPPKRRGKK